MMNAAWITAVPTRWPPWAGAHWPPGISAGPRHGAVARTPAAPVRAARPRALTPRHAAKRAPGPTAVARRPARRRQARRPNQTPGTTLPKARTPDRTLLRARPAMGRVDVAAAR